MATAQEIIEEDRRPSGKDAKDVHEIVQEEFRDAITSLSDSSITMDLTEKQANHVDYCVRKANESADRHNMLPVERAAIVALATGVAAYLAAAERISTSSKKDTKSQAKGKKTKVRIKVKKIRAAA